MKNNKEIIKKVLDYSGSNIRSIDIIHPYFNR